MAKKRVHEIAKERGITSKEALAVLRQAGLDVAWFERNYASDFNGISSRTGFAGYSCAFQRATASGFCW